MLIQALAPQRLEMLRANAAPGPNMVGSEIPQVGDQSALRADRRDGVFQRRLLQATKPDLQTLLYTTPPTWTGPLLAQSPVKSLAPLQGPISTHTSECAFGNEDIIPSASEWNLSISYTQYIAHIDAVFPPHRIYRFRLDGNMRF